MEAFMLVKKSQIFKMLITMFFFCLLPVILGCTGSGSIRNAGFTPGTYEGTGNGRRGPVRILIQLSQAGIDDIVIVSHREDVYPGAAAMEELLEGIIETGSTDMDAISGATFSSRGFLEAVEDALRKASAR